MSVPRVLLVPTHRTGLANALAASVAEIVTAQGRQARCHHLGPLNPAHCWDRWEGTAFVDPGLCTEDALLGLYEVATRNADLSLLSSCMGVLDRREGADWLPTDVARVLDCPVVVVMDCRGWGTGIRSLVTGLRSHLAELNLAGAILSGVADRLHLDLLREVFSAEGVPVAGCLFHGDGPGWDTSAPGAWGLPLDGATVEAVSRQIDVAGLVSLAGQRGFLPSQSWLNESGAGGPVIAVAAGNGFTPWSRESIEVLRASGAEVRRLDLMEDNALPEGTAGLVLAGTLWPATVPDIAMNTLLLGVLRQRISEGLPTVALGGGMLLLLDKVQDSLGRSADLAGVVPAGGEILWDLDEPSYVEVIAHRDNLLFAAGETVRGWVLTDSEVIGSDAFRDSPLKVRSMDAATDQAEGTGGDSLLSSRVFVHLGAKPGMAARFVRRCAAFGAHGA